MLLNQKDLYTEKLTFIARGAFLKNSTIALLVGILIVISFATFFVSPSSFVYITGGAASGTSSTAFNLTGEISILVTGAIDFGSGRVFSNTTYAILDSSAATGGETTYTFEWDNLTGISGNGMGDRQFMGFTYLPDWVTHLYQWTVLEGVLDMPAYRDMGGIFYDKNKNVFIYYGGYDEFSVGLNETWQFNYSNKQWTNLTSSAGAPTPSNSFGIAYDSSTGEAIIFGGLDPSLSVVLNETWKFNSSGKWQNMSPSGEIPPPRDNSAMAFDSKRNVAVLFGGYVYDADLDAWIASSETWEYNVSANSWTNKTGATRPLRMFGTMAFDSRRNVSVLFSGQAYDMDLASFFTINETWEYDGTDWTNVTGSVDGEPSARASVGMVYDSKRGVMVLAGGDDINNGNDLADTWAYDGTSWVNENLNFTGARNTVSSLVFNPDLNYTFLFFGSNFYDASYYDDIQYNDIQETNITPAMADVFLTYGGYRLLFEEPWYETFNETWIFNYSSKEWTNISDLTSSYPKGVSGYGISYDPVLQGAILFGGSTIDDSAFCTDVGYQSDETWLFNGSDWVNLAPSSSPPPLMFPSMVYDAVRNVTILYGGLKPVCAGSCVCVPSGETWEYASSANTWTNVITSTQPPTGGSISYDAFNTGEVAMAFDSSRGVAVAVLGWHVNEWGEGTTATIYDAETWEYDGTDWTNVTSSISGSPPTNVSGQGMAYDPVRQKIVLIGGTYLYEDENTSLDQHAINETWEYNGSSWSPTVTFAGARNGFQHVAFDSGINKTLMLLGEFPYVGESHNTYYNMSADVDLYNVTSSGGGGDNGTGGCINGTWSFGPGFIYVENDGTVNISVNFTANKNAGQFIGGTSFTPSFKIKGMADEAGACPDLNDTWAEVPNSSQAPNVICPVLNYANDRDKFKIPARLFVPSDVAPGLHNSTLTLSATQT